MLDLLLALVGVALLWGSSEAVVHAVPTLARRLGVSEITVTILGVSVFSSLPELSVSALAAAQGNADISLGNVIGSNFVTLTFVTAVCAMIRPMDMHRQIRDRESSWMILSTVAILVLARDGFLSRIDGALLIGLYLPYAWAVWTGAREEDPSGEDSAAGSHMGLAKGLGVALAAIGGIVLGAKLALDHGQAFAQSLGLPDLLLGAVLFAFGTSLPELAIAVVATLRRKSNVSMGEIYSSNIFTALGVLGICCLIHPLALANMRILDVDVPFLILGGVVVQIFVTTGLVLNRLEAVGLLLLYGYFVAAHLVPGLTPWSF